MGGEKPAHLHKPAAADPRETSLDSRCPGPSLSSNKENLQLESSMETASCSQRQVEAAAAPADAAGPGASRPREADCPPQQLLPSIEGDLWQPVRVGGAE